jgi:hypothetical protein
MSLANSIGTAIGATGIVVLIVLLVIFGPLMGVWAINTLFHTNTAYNFWTWLASLLFFGMLKSATSK